LADRVIEIDIFLIDQGVDVIFEQLSQALGPREISQNKHIFAQGGGEFSGSAALEKTFVHRTVASVRRMAR